MLDEISDADLRFLIKEGVHTGINAGTKGIIAREALKELLTCREEARKTCTWFKAANAVWTSGCGEPSSFAESPRFCPYCGHRVSI